MTLDGNAVRSVDRAAALLLALGESHGEAGVTELARKLVSTSRPRRGCSRRSRSAATRN